MEMTLKQTKRNGINSGKNKLKAAFGRFFFGANKVSPAPLLLQVILIKLAFFKNQTNETNEIIDNCFIPIIGNYC